MPEISAARPFTIGLIQGTVLPEADQNVDRALAAIERAANDGAQVICLPELYRTQYFCQQEDAACFDLAESFPNPSMTRFQEAAARLGVALVVPFFEKRAPGLCHNSAAVIDADGTIAGLYRKMHLPDDPAYYEKYYFTPGDLGFPAFDTAFGRIGVLICWDQWFPEAARLIALHGANVIFYPTAIGWHPHEKERYGAAQRDAWITVQRGHAIANGVYIAAVNRVGFERPVAAQPGLEFWGSSFIAEPQGVLLAQAPPDREEILLATVDPRHLETIRRNWPFLRDRRIDAYQDITLRFRDESPEP